MANTPSQQLHGHCIFTNHPAYNTAFLSYCHQQVSSTHVVFIAYLVQLYLNVHAAQVPLAMGGTTGLAHFIYIPACSFNLEYHDIAISLHGVHATLFFIQQTVITTSFMFTKKVQLYIPCVIHAFKRLKTAN